MRNFAIAVVGQDKPGIAAAVAAVLVRAESNIEDSRMTILGGHFTIMMLVAVPESADTGQLESDLENVRERLGLDAVMLRPVDDTSVEAPVPTHVLTVYGVDHPGIVHAVTTALAERSVNIEDLATRVGGDEQAIYTLICEISLPSGLAEVDLTAALADVGSAQGVEVSLRPLERDVL